jgi:hypothetical protein
VARQVVAHAETDTGPVRADGDATKRLRDLPPGGHATASFPFHADRAGPARVLVSVSSASASPEAGATVRVRRGEGLSTLERIGRVAILGVVFIPAVIVITIALVRRRRSQ